MLIRVGRARTGLGLFATAPIEKGAFIAEYSGRRIAIAAADAREKRGARHMYEINGRWTVDGSCRSNIARYANHSCRPNAESDVIKGKVILRAIKAIRPGDEITYHYGDEYFDRIISRIGCQCERCGARPHNTPHRMRRRKRAARSRKARAIDPVV